MKPLWLGEKDKRIRVAVESISMGGGAIHGKKEADETSSPPLSPRTEETKMNSYLHLQNMAVLADILGRRVAGFGRNNFILGTTLRLNLPIT